MGVGSNIAPEQHIIAALHGIAKHATQLRISPIYQCPPVGFEGNLFYNLVIEFQYKDNLSTLQKWLSTIELNLGKPVNTSSYQSRTIDLDILLADNIIELSPYMKIPRSDIVQFAFVLKPLMDLAPELIHPILQLSMAELWKHSQLKEFPLTDCNPRFKQRLLEQLDVEVN